MPRKVKSKIKAQSQPAVRGYTPEQIEAAVAARNDAAGRTAPCVLDALFPDGARIAGVRVIPLSVASYTLLEKLGNPIIEPGGLTKMSNDHVMELCFVLTRSVSECREVLAGGKDAWEDAYTAFGETIPFEGMAEVGKVVGAVVGKASSTFVPTQPKKKATEKSSKKK